MSIVSQIMDGDSRRLKIYDEGQIGVVQHNHPPKGEQAETFPFRQYFENGGSNNMVVNGSTTPVEFSIDADTTGEKDIWVKSINVYVADTGATLQKFGNLTALSNGVEFEWASKESGVITIHEGIKTNLEWFRLSDQIPQIIDLSGSGADAIIVPIDLRKIFGTQWGIQLTKGSTDRLTFKVNDALAGITTFNIIGYGIKI